MDENLCLEIVQFVRIKGGLKRRVIKSKIAETISDRLKSSISSISSLARDYEFLRLVCCCIENVVEKKWGIDKKELAIEIMRKCFPLLSDADIEMISENIESLYLHKQIKRVPYYRRLWTWMWASKKKDY